MTLFLLLAIFAPLLTGFGPEQIHDGALRLPPFWNEGSVAKFPLGTDDLGRDVLTRLIYGSRVSLAVGAIVVLISGLLGTVLGFLAGYFGGWVDSLISRGVDVLLSLPSILIAIVVVAILGPSLINGILAVSIVALPGFIRVSRAAVIVEKQKLFVSAAYSYGAKETRIALKHILPNCMAPLLIQASLGFSDGILNIAALGFLGLGAQPPTPEWGTMLSDAKSFISSSPWLVTLPGLCILIVVLGFNLLGDGLRDLLDPKLKNR